MPGVAVRLCSVTVRRSLHGMRSRSKQCRGAAMRQRDADLLVARLPL